jgi:hypothetical protein
LLAQRTIWPALENHSQRSGRLAAFLDGLQQLGWTDGRNVRIDVRWGAGDADLSRKYAAELVALGPDIILASGDPVMAVHQSFAMPTKALGSPSSPEFRAWPRGSAWN